MHVLHSMELAHLLLVFAPILATVAMILSKIAKTTPAVVTASRRLLPLPPEVGSSLPWLLLSVLARGPLQVIRNCYSEMGSVFTLRLLHRRVTFLVGPDVSAHFYQGLDSEISQDEVSQFTVPTFGPGVGFDVDLATRREQFRFFGDIMKPGKLRIYATLIHIEVQKYFARWGESGTVDLKQELEHLVTLMVSRCLFGEEVRGKMFSEVSTRLRELNEGMSAVTVMFPRLPTPAHHRRDRARARLGEIFSEIVRSRKATSCISATTSPVEVDMLQCLIDSRYKDGRATTETEVVGMLVSALFAGQHTSSNASTWTGACLLSSGDHLRAAIEEQELIMERHGDRVDYEVLQEMGTLHRCIKEALRLHPPSMVLMRHARRSFSVRTREGDEYEVPEGHTVVSPLLIHNTLPHVYRDPEKYDPDRFGPGRAEDKAGGAFSYTAFGGGRHGCVGEAFAYMQIKVVWSYLLRNFGLDLVSQFPETDWMVVLPGPKGNVMVSYKRRRLCAAAK